MTRHERKLNVVQAAILAGAVGAGIWLAIWVGLCWTFGY